MSFHFASTEYAACFKDLPTADVPFLRESAIHYLNSFDETTWFNDPIASLLNGDELRGGRKVDTVNALGQINGKQEYATADQIKALKNHIITFKNYKKDLRVPLREIEKALLTEHAGELIGNQCIDFQKQDGITEMEEATMANHVERKLNDLVLREESAGRITVNRKPVYVSCVSNFTNFLDLFRKTVRSLELGIPCIVLGRSNTVQHSYRWTKLLMELCLSEGIDPGMITYLSCPIEDIIDITQSCQEFTGNLYSTCSRDLAASIKSGYPNTVTSTGGPNTLVALDWTGPIKEAIRMSATIESSGQCTALRHAVVPATVNDDDISSMLNGTKAIESASEAVQAGDFDCVFPNHNGSGTVSTSDGYKHHESIDACYRISDALPPNHMNEYWRRVVVDVSTMDAEDHIDGLAAWLNINQPITLAVTGKTKEQSLGVGLALWERTGLVVNTIGSPENPALTCQARPQEGEVFGEFPPRHLIDNFTKYPVIVPSSTPGYDCSYSDSFLKEQAEAKSSVEKFGPFLQEINDTLVRGFCVTLLEYLLDACQENPKRGFGTSRTALWGLQRPPLNTTTYLQCDSTSWDDLAPFLILFLATNAKDQVVVYSGGNHTIETKCKDLGIAVKAEGKPSLAPGDNMKYIHGPLDSYPMAGQFITTLFPVGHIKSTESNDEDFVARAKILSKWLKVE